MQTAHRRRRALQLLRGRFSIGGGLVAAYPTLVCLTLVHTGDVPRHVTRDASR